MGEKGNPAGLAGGTSLVTGPGVGSIIERTTLSATTTIADVSQDLAGTIADKSIGAVADNVVETVRDSIHEKSAGDGPDNTPSTA